MNDVRLVEAHLEIDFGSLESNPEGFELEFNLIAERDDDAIGQWLRTSRAKGDTSDSDPVVLHLLVELYRKMDRVENLILGKTTTYLPLDAKAKIEKIGFDHFELSEPLLETSQYYYGRIELPVLPQRLTPVFFEALSPTLAKITRIHIKDANEWGAYMTARERAIIRHMKGLE
ncbi:MAG TPA: hypothetical protein VFX68_05185 [Sulfuricurvum sp.]|nr:hypothetical protein [Sulfuricurvum sp.]